MYVAARAQVVSNGALADDAGSLVARFRAASEAAEGSTAALSVRRLDDAIELLSLRVLLPPFFAALNSLELLPRARIEALEQASRPLLDDVALDAVSGALADARRVLGDLTTPHVAFIAELHAQGGLLDFLKSFETAGGGFRDRATFINQQVQGSGEFEVGLVRSLSDAQRWLEPFYVAARPLFGTVAALSVHLRELAAVGNLVEKAQTVRNLSAHVATLKTLFAAGDEESTRAILTFVRQNMPTSCFISQLEGAPGGAALMLEYAPSAEVDRQRMPQVSSITTRTRGSSRKCNYCF